MNSNDFLFKLSKQLYEEENKPVKTDLMNCEYCHHNLIQDDYQLICSYCGTIANTEFVDDLQDPCTISAIKYSHNKPYSRVKHLMKLIRKINCNRNSLKDNINVNEIISNSNITAEDDVNTVKQKINDFRINQYIIMNKIKPNYLLINTELQEEIRKLYVKIERIYFDKINLPNRKNFINNFFILKKILTLLNRSDIADKIHSLKVYKNRIQYENIWNKILAYLK